MASGAALIAAFWPERGARLKMIAVQGMVIELGSVVVLAVGAWLSGLDWRCPFLIYLVTWVLLAAQLLAMPRPERPRPPEGGLPAGATGWPFGVFLTAAATMAVFFTGVLGLPIILRGLGWGSGGAGLFLSFVSLVAAASTRPAAARHCGEEAAFLTAFASYAAALLVFASGAPLAVALVGAVLMGVGFGLSVPLVNHCMIEVAPADPGPLLATLSLALFLGQFLVSFLALVPGAPESAFVAAAAIAAAAVMLGRRVLRRPPLRHLQGSF